MTPVFIITPEHILGFIVCAIVLLFFIIAWVADKISSRKKK